MDNLRVGNFIPANRQSALVVALLFLATPAAAVIHTGIDAEAQLPFWEMVEEGVSVRLVQRLPDQTRGFYQARGFSVAHSELVAQSCMFQTVFRNVSPPATPVTISYNLDEWTVLAGGQRRRMKTREDWQREWTARRAPKPAQLAFEWGLMPTRQTYRAGDYNWGLSVFNLAPGTRFDLELVWHQDGQRRQARIDGVECAPDIHVSPAAP